MLPSPITTHQPASADLARLRAELEHARRIQFGLFPKTPPSIPELDLWGISQPAFMVGGDFYDFIFHPGLSLTFFIGDISGMGLPAALMMTMTRAILKAEADSQPAPTPENILQRANQKLLTDFIEVDMFASVFVGQFYPSSHILVYANAGHYPVIFYPEGGDAQVLEPDGNALGVQQKCLCRNHHLCLAEGDLLVASTDGLHEARNPLCEQFGISRLINQVHHLNGQSAAEISTSLLETIREFTASEPQADDQTVVVLRCTGQ